MSSLIDAALAYAERGWPVFPCRANKMPYTDNGVLDATTDPARIREWWKSWPRANIGMHVGEAGFMVLDFDPGSDQAELARNLGELPVTKLRAKTPRGGEHWFYALNPGEIVSPSASKLADHVDVRSFNSYVLLWPSRTADGEYGWLEEGKPTHRTDAMVALANTYREKHEDRDNWIIEPDLDENVASAIKWLKSDAKISIEGRGGDNTAYATAAMMKSFGISPELAFDLMWEHWNPRCAPPWTPEDADHLEAKVQNGYSYNTSPPGNVTKAYRVARAQTLFKPVERALPSGRELNAGRFRFVDREGMQHVRPPEWLVGGFLPVGGFSMLAGSPGTFKTFIALDIALSIATGASFPWTGMWGEIGAPGPVLFAAGEGRAGITSRVQAWEATHWRGKMVGSSSIILADPVPRVGGEEGEWDQFIEGAKTLHPEGYKLVVIDTVSRSMQGLNENAQQDASGFTQLVERLQKELGCAVLALHHVNKDGSVRGSTVFHGDVDTLVALERDPKSMNVALNMLKQKEAPEWEGPVIVSMTEVQIGNGLKSLAAIKPQSEQKPARTSAAANEARGQVEDAMIGSMLDKALVAVLKANPSKAWSTRDLAEAVAMRPEVSIGSERLRKRITTLREDKNTQAHKSYDPLTKRWRLAV